jgi:hypothetical protein
MTAMPSLRRLVSRLRSRRTERRRTLGERTLKRNEAKAQRLRHERFDDRGGPLGPGI